MVWCDRALKQAETPIDSPNGDADEEAELLPSSDEVDKRAFWLHFETQQSHLGDGENGKRGRGQWAEIDHKEDW